MAYLFFHLVLLPQLKVLYETRTEGIKFRRFRISLINFTDCIDNFLFGNVYLKRKKIGFPPGTQTQVSFQV